MKKQFQESELILNADGSVYHLHLRPENIAPNVIVVGDQNRVETISNRFDKIEFKTQSREFVTHTGYIGKTRITALSTGIGTDNIDIVLNELDAAVNIDLENRVEKAKKTRLNIIRLGTSGALQPDIATDTFVASAYGLGLDGLLHYYTHDENLSENEMVQSFISQTSWPIELPHPYIIRASEELLTLFAANIKQGITATASGFFGPQGRELRIPLARPDLNELIENFSFKGNRITNFEMETSAIYALGRMLGHNTLTICAIIANRVTKTYSSDYNKTIVSLIDHVLEKLDS